MDDLKNHEAASNFHPQSLSKLCLCYVARNLQLVDSFRGMPDIIGEDIFVTAETHGTFDEPVAGTFKKLQLFADAFGFQLLYSLTLCGQHLLLNSISDHLSLFNGLTALDISQCGLGDDHEIFRQFRYLNNLAILKLSDNALTTRGLQKITMPLRILQEGPLQLKSLDISENQDLDIGIVKYMKVFTYLECLDVSCTRILEKDIHYIQQQLHLVKLREVNRTDQLALQVHTQGWAKGVIKRWNEQVTRTRRREKTPVMSFYSKRPMMLHSEPRQQKKGKKLVFIKI